MLGPYLLGGRGPGRFVGDGGEGDPGFPEPPIVTDVNGNVTINGKVKPGSFGKFVYPLATVAANRQYTFRAVANFSQLAKQGNLAMVGFGFKNGNDFHLDGLRGDGAGGTKEYIVHGTPPNGWNKQTGHTEVDNGAAGAGTQHSAYYRLVTSSDGATYSLSTSADGAVYTPVVTGQALTPFSNISGVATFGVALWFNNTDAGFFTIQITEFANAPGVTTATVYSITQESTDGGWAGFTIAHHIADSNLSAASGDWVRLTLTFDDFSGATMSGLYFGRNNGGGEVFDFTGTQVQILFGASGSIVADGVTLVYVSDWMQLGEAYDETLDYVVAAQFAAGGTVVFARATTGAAANQTHYKAGADAATTDKTGYSFHMSGAAHLLTKIEIATGNPG